MPGALCVCRQLEVRLFGVSTMIEFWDAVTGLVDRHGVNELARLADVSRSNLTDIVKKTTVPRLRVGVQLLRVGSKTTRALTQAVTLTAVQD